MSNNAVIYARYSSTNQKETSIEQQVLECTDFAEGMGLKILTVYPDKALTGKNDDRPFFQKMIADSKKKLFSYAIVYKNDRFARNRRDANNYKAELKSAGVKVLFAKESIPEGPEGIVLESVLEGMAEFYSENLAQNVKRGLMDNARKGKVNGRLPYGYRNDGKGNAVICEKEAAAVRKLFECKLEGFSLTECAEILFSSGFTTRLGNKFTLTSLSKMLTDDWYIGTYKYRDIVLPDRAPAIVDKVLFEHIQRNMAARTCTSTTEYILTKFLKCGCCNAPMAATSGTGKSGKLYHYYRCYHSIQKQCTEKSFSKEQVEDFVKNQLAIKLQDNKFQKTLVNNYWQEKDSSVDKRKLEKEMTIVYLAIQHIVTAVSKGCYSENLNLQLQQLELRENEIRKELYQIKSKAPSLTKEELLLQIKELLPINSTAKLKKALNLTVSDIFCSAETFKIDYRLNI